MTEIASSGRPSDEEVAKRRRAVGAMIRARRKAKGWNQTRLGQEARVSRTWLSAVETGEPASPNLIARILSVLGIDDHEEIAASILGPAEIVTQAPRQRDEVTDPQNVIRRDIDTAIVTLRQLLADIDERGTLALRTDAKNAVTAVQSRLEVVSRFDALVNRDEAPISPDFLRLIDWTLEAYRMTRRMLELVRDASDAAFRTWAILRGDTATDDPEFLQGAAAALDQQTNKKGKV